MIEFAKNEKLSIDIENIIKQADGEKILPQLAMLLAIQDDELFVNVVSMVRENEQAWIYNCMPCYIRHYGWSKSDVQRTYIPNVDWSHAWGDDESCIIKVSDIVGCMLPTNKSDWKEKHHVLFNNALVYWSKVNNTLRG